MTATDDHASLMAEDSVSQAGLRACQEILREESCRSVRYFAQVDSTNSAACRDLHNPSAVDPLSDKTQLDPTLPLPRLYLADAQTAGRGRLGRQWLADDGTLTFTLLLDVGDAGCATIPRDTLPLVALASGVAVARAIEFLRRPGRGQNQMAQRCSCRRGSRWRGCSSRRSPIARTGWSSASV